MESRPIATTCPSYWPPRAASPNRDLLPDHNTITVDRGLSHGVQKNMAALTIGGVIGYTFRVENDSSQILLLTDRYAVIDAVVQRSRARGLVEGMRRTNCRLRYLKRSDDLKVGDLVVTSGLFNIFPKGFPIGTVTSIDKSRYGMTQEVEIKPSVEPLNLEELFIVLNANHQDLSTDGDTHGTESSESGAEE